MVASIRVIRSRDNAQVKQLLRLATSSRARRGTGMTILDGAHLVEAYARSGGTAEALTLGESACRDANLRALFDQTPARNRFLLADDLIGRISQVVTSSGIVAVIRTPESPPLPISIDSCVMIEGIQDPGNLGSILRSAVAAGIKHVCLSPGSVFVWAPKVVRAGQGAHFLLRVHENVAFDEVGSFAGLKIVAAEPRARLSVFEADLRRPIAWLFGNEGAGLSERAMALATEHVRIPMPGQCESLNVAAAVAICLFEQVRQNFGTV